jgi:hypothetical protein
VGVGDAVGRPQLVSSNVNSITLRSSFLFIFIGLFLLALVHDSEMSFQSLQTYYTTKSPQTHWSSGGFLHWTGVQSFCWSGEHFLLDSADNRLASDLQKPQNRIGGLAVFEPPIPQAQRE